MLNIKPSDTKAASSLTPEQLGTLASLQLKLNSLGVEGDFLPTVVEGPVVTLYRFVPKNATRVSLVERLAPDMAIALGADVVQVRRMPGENAIGIFVPNKIKKLLTFRDSVGEVWKKSEYRIPVGLGIDFTGKFIVEDLASLPHMLVAGSTGSGKSTWMNSVLAGLLYCRTSDQLRIVLSDTKQVEFTHFCGAPHLLFPPATNVKQSIDYLDFLVSEIDERLQKIGKSGFQNILQYNSHHKDNPRNKLPYILLVIDELADLLMCDIKEEQDEGPCKRYGKIAEARLGTIVQKARASGVHVIAAVQRPSVKIVEGNIKSNFPARITFRLPSEADSRTVLGTSGAEQLLSQGDMLFLSPNNAAIRRIHAPLVEISDIQAAVELACRRE
jgi:DNA segregation ATPase FtsK/SpoIIIE, S-DNA-T family